MTTLRGRTVLVTGATSGFGEATARLFAKKGAQQVLLARRKDRLERLCEELEAPTHPVAVDVTDQPDVLRAIQTLPPAYKDISVLVNNAGLSLGLGPAHLNDLDDWNTMVDTNIKGVLACVHAILPRMVEETRATS
jgi:NADP-dependent 3-hydroxy acid dehydrogenase YdfG